MTSVDRDFRGNADDAVVSHGMVERYLSRRAAHDNPLAIFEEFASPRSVPVSQFVFGGCRYCRPALERVAGFDWPMMWLQGDSCSGEHLNGTQVMTVDGSEVKRLELGGRVVASMFSDEDADYCVGANIVPADCNADRSVQARQCFERIEQAVAMAGMDFTHVARTWLFLDHLLDWYGEFNQVRTTFFRERGVFDHVVPSSTGIGACNPEGAAIVAGFFAVKPRHDRVTLEAIPSPLQCPAVDYKSSFSRASEIGYPDRRHLMISGTASIAPGGESVYKDDIDKQIELTLDVIEAILQSRNMTWTDTTRVIAYFADMRDAPRFDVICRRRGIDPLPFVRAHAIVCRHDLLFEAEWDAIKVR